MATRRTTKVEIGLAAAGAQSTQQANEAREPVAAVDSNGKPAFDNGKSGKKPQQQKSRFLALFLGALLLSFNVAAVMLMDLSKDQDGKYPFNTASAVVCAEFSKFIIASIGFSKALRTNPMFAVAGWRGNSIQVHARTCTRAPRHLNDKTK